MTDPSQAAARPWPIPSPAETAAVRTLLSRTAEAPADERWNAFPRELWPALFTLLDLAADLPRLATSSALPRLRPELWPELEAAARDVLALQALIDAPVVLAGAEPASVLRADDPAAREELERRHTVHVEGLLDDDARARLAGSIERLRRDRPGFWGSIPRPDGDRRATHASPSDSDPLDDDAVLHHVFDGLLAGDAFRRLTGFDPDRDESTLTLSLQSLDHAGIGWHRDLYWPKEWVGQDVFAVLVALGSDSPEKGGAFLSHVPWENRVFSHYRRAGETTILWNAAFPDGRLLHAVSGYRGVDTSRHLVILQCLRRRTPPR